MKTNFRIFSNFFFKRFIEEFFKNENLKKFDIYFKFRNDLIYYIIKDNRERFYISYFLEKKIFYIIYNLLNNNNFNKTYN